MSDDFLSCIKSFSKSTLVPVSTVVTLTTGVKYELSAGETTCTKLQERGAGFVVDDKPDLTVGIVLPHLLLGVFAVWIQFYSILSYSTIHNRINGCGRGSAADAVTVSYPHPELLSHAALLS